MNIDNIEIPPKLFVDITGVATVTKEMNASFAMSDKLKQVNPGLDSAAMEHCVDGQQEGGVSSAIKWMRIIFHRLNNLFESGTKIGEVEMETNEDNVGIINISEEVPIVSSHTCL